MANFNPLRSFRPIRTFIGLLLRRPIVGTSLIPMLPDGRVVLIRRRDSGLWGLPGGIVDWGEDIATAAGRELKEETGLVLTSVGRLVGVYSSFGRDPRFHAVCVAIEAQVEGEIAGFDPEEVLEVKAFLVGELVGELSGKDFAHDNARQLQDYFEGKTIVA